MGDDNRKNPWGNRSNDDDKRWNGGRYQGGRGGGSSGGGNEPPDMDEMLRRAQENFRSVMPVGLGPVKVFIIGFAVVLALWLSSGFFIVNPGEHAVIQRFGALARTQVEPGLGYHFPAPIESATVINVQEIRKMTIGFDGRAATRGGTSGQSESLMLTSDRNIIDLDLELQWNIKSAEDFLFEIRDQENTIKKVAESAIREIVGQTNMFAIITNQRQLVADQTKDIIQKNLDDYNSGVNVTQVLIQSAEVHPGVQSAFQDVQSAKQDAEDVQNRAQAYREDIIPKARGQAIQLLQEAEAYQQSTIARSTGDADRFNSVYKAYLTGKDVTKERIYLETMEDVLRNAQKIILDGSGGGQGVVPYLPLNELQRSPEATPRVESNRPRTRLEQ